MGNVISKSKIEWCDYSWSPCIGCRGDCTIESHGYQCYWKSFYDIYGKKIYPELKDHQDVQFIERNFEKNFPKKPSRIFVNPFSDPYFWDIVDSIKIWNRIKENPQHTFIILTKNINVYERWGHVFEKLKNVWCGITINITEQMGKQDIFHLIPNNIRFLSLEPLREEIPIELFKPHLVDWIILGGQSGPGEKFYPSGKWIDDLRLFCSSNKIPLFIKDNFEYYRKGLSEIHGTFSPIKQREWPEVKK